MSSYDVDASVRDRVSAQPFLLLTSLGILSSAVLTVLIIQTVLLLMGQHGVLFTSIDVSVDIATLAIFNIIGVATKRIMLGGLIGVILLGGFVSVYVFHLFSTFDIGSARLLVQNIGSPVLNAVFMVCFARYARLFDQGTRIVKPKKARASKPLY